MDHQICDVSEDLNAPQQALVINCNVAFICETVNIDAMSLELNTDVLHVTEAILIGTSPKKARNGKNGVNNGENGQIGENGANGMQMKMTAKSILKGSGLRIDYSLPGGEGGDGGNGVIGGNAIAPTPYTPNNVQQVISSGVLVNSVLNYPDWFYMYMYRRD